MRSSALALTATLLWLLTGRLVPAIAQTNPTTPQTETTRQRPSLKIPGDESASRQATPQTGTNDETTIRVDTTLVTLPVSVLDRNGKYVPHLTKQDFSIYEDGVEQEIADFAAIETPFNVVLLLDTSRSTRFKIEEIQRAAIAFVEQLRSHDRVMVVSFDEEVYIDSEFTSDRTQLRRAIYGTRTGGGTKLYDAVDLVITERLNQIEGRKAIVLFTDGVDTMSKFASARSTLELVEESDVLVYPIRYDTESDVAGPRRRGGRRPPVIINPWPLPRWPQPSGRRWPMASLPQRGSSPEEYRRGAQYLRELAERSGARLYQADTLGNLSQAFSLIADELRHQYTLSYYPTNTARDGSYRRIRVIVNRPDLVVRARAGYRAASGEAPYSSARPTLKRDRR